MTYLKNLFARFSQVPSPSGCGEISARSSMLFCCDKHMDEWLARNRL